MEVVVEVESGGFLELEVGFAHIGGVGSSGEGNGVVDFEEVGGTECKG